MKILCIGAHPDDNEFRCGGLALKLKAKGHEVQFLSACNGDRGHQTMTLVDKDFHSYCCLGFVRFAYVSCLYTTI